MWLQIKSKIHLYFFHFSPNSSPDPNPKRPAYMSMRAPNRMHAAAVVAEKVSILVSRRNGSRSSTLHLRGSAQASMERRNMTQTWQTGLKDNGESLRGLTRMKRSNHTVFVMKLFSWCDFFNESSLKYWSQFWRNRRNNSLGKKIEEAKRILNPSSICPVQPNDNQHRTPSLLRQIVMWSTN